MIKIDEIIGYKKRIIKVISEINNADRCFIIYPGMNYGYNHPFFYYFRMMLKVKNIDYIFFDYNWSEQKELFQLADKNIEEEIRKEIIESYKYMKNSKIENVSIIGKSIGTTAIEIYHEQYENRGLDIEEIYWITPFENTKNLINIRSFDKEKEYIYVGTADPYYDKEIYDAIRDKVKIREFKGLGHSFEKNNGIIESIEGLKGVLEVLENDIFE